jgi:fatty-acyl-CoA synthase
LAGYKKPRHIDILKDLPKNAVGKIMKDILRKKEWAGYERMVH